MVGTYGELPRWIVLPVAALCLGAALAGMPNLAWADAVESQEENGQLIASVLEGEEAQEADEKADDAETLESDVVLPSDAGETPGEPAPLPDGVYVIRANTAAASVLDVAGGSAESGANVQLYSYNGTAAQKWHLAYDPGTGFYTITSLVAGKALDISGASTDNGANVQVWGPNGTDAQRWRVEADGTGWRLESALAPGLVLDIAGAGSANGTNAQAYAANGTAAQRFHLLALDPDVAPSTAAVAEGAYELSCSASGKALDISGGSRESSANVQQYAGNSTYAQRFYLEPDGSGFYGVYSVGSGLALDVAGAGIMPGTNVWQYRCNGTDAQLWSLRDNGDGTVTLVSKATGLALDIAGASKDDGANAQMWIPNGSAAQSFTLTPCDLLSEGAVKLYSAAKLTGAVAVSAGSTEPEAAVLICNQAATTAQKLVVAKRGSGLALTAVCSALYVAQSESAVIQAASETIWSASFSKSGARRGIVLSAPDGNVLTASGTADKSPLVTARPSDALAQSFLPTYGNLIDNGIYTIASAVGDKVIDAQGGKRVNGTNVQLYTPNGTNAQKYRFTNLGGGWYTIANASSGRALDVKGGSAESGANVQLYKSNGTNAQKWRAELLEGGNFRFVNAVSGMVLDVANAADVKGANVQVAEMSDSAGQVFSIANTSLAKEGVDLGVPSIWQEPELPTGCESVALTNVLLYYGFNLGKSEIADHYMPWSGWDFVYSFMGNPHSTSGSAIMAPGIADTANSYLSSKGSGLRATDITGASFESLYSYIDSGVPVVVWSTMYFGNRGRELAWQDGFTLYSGTHAVTLAGYNADKTQVLVSDPLSGSVWRDADRFESLYEQMGSQAVVIQ